MTGVAKPGVIKFTHPVTMGIPGPIFWGPFLDYRDPLKVHEKVNDTSGAGGTVVQVQFSSARWVSIK